MTDETIRKLLDSPARLALDQQNGLLKELLQHRLLRVNAKWAVWQQLEGNWQCVGWFPDRRRAEQYRQGDGLVLPANEQVSETAR